MGVHLTRLYSRDEGNEADGDFQQRAVICFYGPFKGVGCKAPENTEREFTPLVHRACGIWATQQTPLFNARLLLCFFRLFKKRPDRGPKSQLRVVCFVRRAARDEVTKNGVYQTAGTGGCDSPPRQPPPNDTVKQISVRRRLPPGPRPGRSGPDAPACCRSRECSRRNARTAPPGLRDLWNVLVGLVAQVSGQCRGSPASTGAAG